MLDRVPDLFTPSAPWKITPSATASGVTVSPVRSTKVFEPYTTLLIAMVSPRYGDGFASGSVVGLDIRDRLNRDLT